MSNNHDTVPMRTKKVFRDVLKEKAKAIGMPMTDLQVILAHQLKGTDMDLVFDKKKSRKTTLKLLDFEEEFKPFTLFSNPKKRE